MKDFNRILDEIKSFIAIESGVSDRPDMWGFQHPDEDSSLLIIDRLKERANGRQAIINIYANENKKGTFDIQLININNQEILHKRQVFISDNSVLTLRNYTISRRSNRVFLMPFDIEQKGIYATPGPYVRHIEVIPNKLLL